MPSESPVIYVLSPNQTGSSITFVRASSNGQATVDLLIVKTGKVRELASVDDDNYFGDFKASTALAVWRPSAQPDREQRRSGSHRHGPCEQNARATISRTLATHDGGADARENRQSGPWNSQVHAGIDAAPYSCNRLRLGPPRDAIGPRTERRRLHNRARRGVLETTRNAFTPAER